MKRILQFGVALVMGVAFLPIGTVAARADAIGPEGFDGFSLGTVNNQFGWSALGSAGSGCAVYDQGIVDPSSIWPQMGTRAFRSSNAVTSGCFGDQAFSAPLKNAAGETTADTGGFPSGTLQSRFTGSFQFGSTTPGLEQPGMYMSISPDNGGGGRMSYVRIEDSPTGYQVYFIDYQDVGTLGSVGSEADGCSGSDNFVETQIGTDLSFSAIHTIKFNIKLLDGPNNDVVDVSIDGSVVHTGTTWEDYYRWCSESNPGYTNDNSRTIRTFEFREGGAGEPSTLGNGYLIDNVRLNSGPASSSSTVVVHPGNMHGFGFNNDGIPNGFGTFRVGPGTPPLGTGSAQLSVDSTGRELIGTLGYSGTRLDEITNLSYASLRQSYNSGNYLAPALQFDVRYRPTDTAYGGRLVFEPYQTPGVSGTITQNTWQTWSPLDGMWWASKITPAGTNGPCGQASPCTWQQVKNLFPDAKINGALLLKAGGPIPGGLVTNVDALTVGVNNTDTTYDFEPDVSAPNTVVVDPGHTHNWTLFQGADTATTGYETGPGTPPLGVGSLNQSVGTNGDDFVQTRNTNYDGVPLADITSLDYSTYVSNNINCQANYMSLKIDDDNNGTVDNRLYFEPCYQDGSYGMAVTGSTIPNQGAQTNGTWQSWNALAGGWWDANGDLGSAGGPPLITIADYLAIHPNAVIRNDDAGHGGVRIIAGGGAGAWDNFVGNTDNVTIGIDDGLGNISSTIFDFEPDAQAPVVSDVTSTPNPVNDPGSVTLSANADDSTTGNANITGAEYQVDGSGPWIAMDATDAAFDSPTEAVQATVAGLTLGDHQLCVRATDAGGNTSAGTDCTTATVSAAPTINIGADSSTAEGNSGSHVVTIPVDITGPSTEPIDVHYNVADGTATSPSDFIAASGTLHWNAGTTATKYISVTVNGDTIDEFNQTVVTTLDTPVNATIGDGSQTLTINDDDAPPQLRIHDVTVVEGNSGRTIAKFVVRLNRPSEKTVTMTYSTVDGSATAPSDYVAVTGQPLTFLPGQTRMVIKIKVKGDTQVEPNEYFLVGLSGVVNALPMDTVGQGVILNDD